MLLSKYFLPLLKSDPRDASIKSHKLMLRAGMIQQSSSGIYTWLPLGVKVLQKISNIVREALDESDCMELIMPLMQPTAIWKESGRYQDGSDLADETLVAVDRHKNELIFSPTAEELVSKVFGASVQSYKDLPKNIYQLHWKFRDEIRPRYGVLRCREFLMKDAYSFDICKEEAIKSYSKMFSAYMNIYRKLGVKVIPVTADSGSMGGDYTHEFHMLAETGESKIFCDRKLLNDSDISIETIENSYSKEESKHEPEKCEDRDIIESKSIEVGHIFYLGQKYTNSMNITVQNNEGKVIHPHMGCYGIGVSRLVGAIIEASCDEEGIIWPSSISPFDCVVIPMKGCEDFTASLHDQLLKKNLDVLLDDTKDSVGKKFARADLIGVSVQIIVSKCEDRKINQDIERYKVEIRSRRNKNEKEILETESLVKEDCQDIINIVEHVNALKKRASTIS